jgi:hypothetical protein
LESPLRIDGISAFFFMDESQRYESAKRFASITGFVVDVVVLVYLVRSHLSIRIRDLAETISTFPWLTVAIYVVAAGAIFKVFDLLLSFYSGYFLEHRFYRGSR